MLHMLIYQYLYILCRLESGQFVNFMYHYRTFMVPSYLIVNIAVYVISCIVTNRSYLLLERETEKVRLKTVDIPCSSNQERNCSELYRLSIQVNLGFYRAISKLFLF